MKAKQDTIDKLCNRFWFVYKIRAKKKQLELQCSEKCASTTLWEVCETIQTLLTLKNGEYLISDMCKEFIFNFLDDFEINTDTQIEYFLILVKEVEKEIQGGN